MSEKKVLAVDFEPILYPGDALAAYSMTAWPLQKPPQEGAFQFLEEAQHYFEVHVVSWRMSHWEYLRWFKQFNWPCDGKTGKPDFIRLVKSPEPGTFVYIANRVQPWTGDFPSPVELTKFSPAKE